MNRSALPKYGEYRGGPDNRATENHRAPDRCSVVPVHPVQRTENSAPDIAVQHHAVETFGSFGVSPRELLQKNRFSSNGAFA